jgi:hypothetical protein
MGDQKGCPEPAALSKGWSTSRKSGEYIRGFKGITLMAGLMETLMSI